MNQEGLGQLFVRLMTGNFEEAVAARQEGRPPVFRDERYTAWPPMIELRTPAEIEQMRPAGRFVARFLLPCPRPPMSA